MELIVRVWLGVLEGVEVNVGVGWGVGVPVIVKEGVWLCEAVSVVVDVWLGVRVLEPVFDAVVLRLAVTEGVLVMVCDAVALRELVCNRVFVAV